MAEESAQFIVNLDNFVSVKKIKVEPKTTIEDIIEYLASVEFTSSQKIKDYLEKLIDSEKLLQETEKLFDLGFEEFYTQINSRKIKTIIGNSIPKHIEKKQKDAYIIAVRIYLLNLYCEKKGIIINYAQIPFPSKKKMMKVKKKK